MPSPDHCDLDDNLNHNLNSNLDENQEPPLLDLPFPVELLNPFAAPLSPISSFLATHAPGLVPSSGQSQTAPECICKQGWQCWVNDLCKDSVVVEGDRCEVCTVSITLGLSVARGLRTADCCCCASSMGVVNGRVRRGALVSADIILRS